MTKFQKMTLRKKAKPQSKGTQHLGLLTHCINTRKTRVKTLGKNGERTRAKTAKA
jgi:hypothetical protein